MTFHARRFGSSFKPGRLDGEKARRRASQLLLNTRVLDHLTIEQVARTCGLSTATAAEMMAAEKARRADG
jgi:hypothetical protein